MQPRARWHLHTLCTVLIDRLLSTHLSSPTRNSMYFHCLCEMRNESISKTRAQGSVQIHCNSHCTSTSLFKKFVLFIWHFETVPLSRVKVGPWFVVPIYMSMQSNWHNIYGSRSYTISSLRIRLVDEDVPVHFLGYCQGALFCMSGLHINVKDDWQGRCISEN